MCGGGFLKPWRVWNPMAEGVVALVPGLDQDQDQDLGLGLGLGLGLVEETGNGKGGKNTSQSELGDSSAAPVVVRRSSAVKNPAAPGAPRRLPFNPKTPMTGVIMPLSRQ